jgi:hypothetical protein
MTTEITRGKLSQLETRVAVVEREVGGEKLVTRHILEQTRRNGDDLAAVKSRLDRVEQKLDRLDHSFNAFVRDFAGTVADTVREVMRERGER